MAITRSYRAAEIQFPNKWAVRWPFCHFVIGDDQLTVRAWPASWIPACSIRKDAVGDITVDNHVHVILNVLPPMLHWRRSIRIAFGRPATAFTTISVKLPLHTDAVDDLRARGYQVIDRR